MYATNLLTVAQQFGIIATFLQGIAPSRALQADIRSGTITADPETIDDLIATEASTLGRILTGRTHELEAMRQRLSSLVAGEGTIRYEGIVQAHRFIRGSFVEGLMCSLLHGPNGEWHHVEQTPLEYSPVLSTRLGQPVYLKREDTQHVGSFKQRGATNLLVHFLMAAVANGLDPTALKVVAVSHGNHAQGVTQAAYNLGIRNVTIYLPANASPLKIRQLEERGALVRLIGHDDTDATFEHAEDIARASIPADDPNTLYVPAFDHPLVSMGQGTVGVEIGLQMALEEHEQYSVVVPTGGGGLISGISTYLASDGVSIYGVESDRIPYVSESFHAGHVVQPDEFRHIDTVADGIALLRIGKKPFPNILDHVSNIVAIPENVIKRGIAYLPNNLGLRAEGAAAAPVAALLSGALEVPEDRPIVIVLSGRNIDEELYQKILAETSG